MYYFIVVRSPKSDMSNFTSHQFLHFPYFYWQCDRPPVHSTLCKRSGEACHVGGTTTEKRNKNMRFLPGRSSALSSTVMIVLLYMHACTLAVNRP